MLFAPLKFAVVEVVAEPICQALARLTAVEACKLPPVPVENVRVPVPKALLFPAIIVEFAPRVVVPL